MEPGQMDVGQGDLARRRRVRRNFLLLLLCGLAALAVIIGAMLAAGFLWVRVDPVREPSPPNPPPPIRVDDQGRTVSDTDWKQRPEPDYPMRAQMAGVEEGSVQLRCDTTTDGRVGPCQVLQETPADAGFGEAAIRAAEAASVYPATIDGEPQTGILRFTVRFRLR